MAQPQQQQQQQSPQEVILAYEDGAMDVTDRDPLVSRLGGLPVWLSPALPRTFQTARSKKPLATNEAGSSNGGGVFTATAAAAVIVDDGDIEGFLCPNCSKRLFLVAQSTFKIL